MQTSMAPEAGGEFLFVGRARGTGSFAAVTGTTVPGLSLGVPGRFPASDRILRVGAAPPSRYVRVLS